MSDADRKKSIEAVFSAAARNTKGALSPGYELAVTCDGDGAFVKVSPPNQGSRLDCRFAVGADGSISAVLRSKPSIGLGRLSDDGVVEVVANAIISAAKKPFV